MPDPSSSGHHARSTSQRAAAIAAIDLRRFYDPKPFTEDPARHVPAAVPSETPLHRLSPVDAPAQARPDDWHRGGVRPRLRFFWPVEFHIATALADALIVPPPGQGPAIRPDEVALNVDRYLAAAYTPMTLQIRVGLRALNLLPVFSGNLPFRFMSSTARRAWCRRFRTNRGLLVPKVAKLKSLIYLGYYSDPRTDHETGYATVLERETLVFREARRLMREKIWKTRGVV